METPQDAAPTSRLRATGPNNCIVRLPQVMERTGLGRSSIYAYIAEGTFPRPAPIGRRAVGWVASELDEWIAARIAKRDAAPVRQ